MLEVNRVFVFKYISAFIFLKITCENRLEFQDINEASDAVTDGVDKDDEDENAGDEQVSPLPPG